MDFITHCKTELAQRFNLADDALHDEHLVITVDGVTLHVEFYPPADHVSVYSVTAQALHEQLHAEETYTLLRGMLQTNGELCKRSLLRLYIDEGRPGLALDCSPLNCRDAEQFGAELQGLLDAETQLRDLLA